MEIHDIFFFYSLKSIQSVRGRAILQYSEKRTAVTWCFFFKFLSIVQLEMLDKDKFQNLVKFYLPTTERHSSTTELNPDWVDRVTYDQHTSIYISSTIRVNEHRTMIHT